MRTLGIIIVILAGLSVFPINLALVLSSAAVLLSGIGLIVVAGRLLPLTRVRILGIIIVVLAGLMVFLNGLARILGLELLINAGLPKNLAFVLFGAVSSGLLTAAVFLGGIGLIIVAGRE
jgi:hypothetical protein